MFIRCTPHTFDRNRWCACFSAETSWETLVRTRKRSHIISACFYWWNKTLFQKQNYKKKITLTIVRECITDILWLIFSSKMSWKAKKKLCGFFACLYFKQNFELFNDMVYVRRDQNQGQGQICSLDLELKKIFRSFHLIFLRDWN